jgi:hypothetical protein
MLTSLYAASPTWLLSVYFSTQLANLQRKSLNFSTLSNSYFNKLQHSGKFLKVNSLQFYFETLGGSNN